jgi:hypothetical protein
LGDERLREEPKAPFSQQAAAPITRPTAIPTSGRWPSINHESSPATAGMTANSMATAAAPWLLTARTYIVMQSVALSSTTAATAPAAFQGSVTWNGVTAASTTT